MKITKIKDVKTPNRGTSKSAGIDFFIPNTFEATTITPGNHILISSGIKVEVPSGYALVGFNKSGVAIKGLDLGACVIDEDFQGEVVIHLVNVSNNDITLEPGQKIAQFVLLPIFYDNIIEVSNDQIHIEQTERGEGKFGSTGQF